MAIWKEQNTVRKDSSLDAAPEHDSSVPADVPQTYAPVHRTPDRRSVPESVIAAGLDFGRSRFAPAAFRVTVASFNARARRTVESLGFEVVGSFAARHDGRPFDVLVRDERR